MVNYAEVWIIFVWTHLKKKIGDRKKTTHRVRKTRKIKQKKLFELKIQTNLWMDGRTMKCIKENKNRHINQTGEDEATRWRTHKKEFFILLLCCFVFQSHEKKNLFLSIYYIRVVLLIYFVTMLNVDREKIKTVSSSISQLLHLLLTQSVRYLYKLYIGCLVEIDCIFCDDFIM